MRERTYTVALTWKTGTGQRWVTLNGPPGPFKTDDELETGHAVRLSDGKAVRA